MRVVMPGSDDPVEFTEVHGTWISEDCEPVMVEFAWQRKTPEEVLSEADCICSHELAARLIHLLLCGGDEEELMPNAPFTAQDLLAMPAVGRGN